MVSEAYLDTVPEAVLGQPKEVITPPTDLEDDALAQSVTGDSGRPVSEFIQATVAASTTESGSASKFVVDPSTNFLFLSCVEESGGDLSERFFHDHEGQSSLFRLKKQVAPAEQMDDIARSSRYAPHLHSLMHADPPLAHSDPIACAATLSSRYYAGSRIEMVTASGTTLRVWDLSKGECTRQLTFHAEPVTCIAGKCHASRLVVRACVRACKSTCCETSLAFVVCVCILCSGGSTGVLWWRESPHRK